MDIQDELAKLMPLDVADEITRKLIEREDKKLGDIEELEYELQEYEDMIDEIRRIV